jgi:predicted nucleic acid-binding protein
VTALNTVDSSGWLEYFAGTKRAALFAPAIEDTGHLIVPIVTVYEVFRKFLRERNESEALEAASAMCSGRVIDLDVSLALEAGRFDLPLADSLIYATTRRLGATLWTQDEDFKGLADVRYFPKK